MHVLIVDDSKFNRGRVHAMLQVDGHRFTEAENGREALERLLADPPDLVVTDLLMPVLGGLELLKELRGRGDQTPVVVLSADIQASSRELCLQFGAAAFLNKPCNSEELRDAVRKALSPVAQESTR